MNCDSLIDKSLSNISFTDNGLGKIIKCLDPNKDHGHDMMSMRMLTICGDSIYKALRIIFRDSLDQGTFLYAEKKSTLRLFIKKRQTINKAL